LHIFKSFIRETGAGFMHPEMANYTLYTIVGLSKLFTAAKASLGFLGCHF
jgi:hypothetical protein